LARLLFANTSLETTLPTVVAPALSTIALILLLGSGAAKILDPDPTTGAMRTARLPASRVMSRSLGLMEITAGAIGIVAGRTWMLPATLLYLGFLVFTTAALQQRLPIQSCGCFGREDTPPTVFHIGFNALCAGVLTFMAVTGQMPVPWSGSLTGLVLYLAFGVIGAFLAYLLLAHLPRTLHVIRTR
jgi:uncharacterized membrane protein YphA (DoxX/SURF4 family)